MSCWESANVLSGVAFILRTSSGPAFPADHTATDTAHPKVVDRNNQASDGRMTAFCGTPRFCSSDERLLSLRVFGCLPVTARGAARSQASEKPRRRKPRGEYAPAAVSVYGDLRRGSARLVRSRTELPAWMGSGDGDFG